MKRKIIVAPLNWGLGHAARCVPIIQFLLENNFVPIIASDGNALCFLQKEFPDLASLELPSYGIRYAKNLKVSLVFQSPKVVKAVKNEQLIIERFLAKNETVVGLISDNRFGVRSEKIPSVYITHQLQVFSGLTTFISSKIHQNILKKFDECWVPDTATHQLAGLLSKNKNKTLNIKYIGALSRFQKETLPKKNDILVVLSGIESQRASLEKKIVEALKPYKGRVAIVRGYIEKEQTITILNGIKIYNYLLSTDLEREINQSELIICRSGYSSILDLAVLGKKAFFIPTKNQPEQEYLAKYLKGKSIAPYCTEKNFHIAQLAQLENYKGLDVVRKKLNPELLGLFQSE